MNKKTLFDDEFPEDIKTDEELMILKEKYSEEYDPYYIATACIKDRKNLIDKLWEKYEPYVDYSFENQYKSPKNFHQRTWEMYVGCMLVENNVIPNKNTGRGPDFYVENSFYIECVACNNADSTESLSYVISPDFTEKRIQCLDVQEDEIILRIRHSINKKIKKYGKYKKEKIVNDNLPFIIAVNSGILHGSRLAGIPPIIVKALFGLDHLSIEIPTRKRKYTSRKYVPGDKKYPLDIFTNDSTKEISAIIFSPNTVINMPTEIGSDCVLVRNPYAETPLNDTHLRFLKGLNDIMPDINNLKIF